MASAMVFDLVTHLYRQRAFSLQTFGPGPRTQGVLDHIRKECGEVEKDPADLMEWVDLILLSLDGAHRAGHAPEAICAAIEAKQERNPRLAGLARRRSRQGDRARPKLKGSSMHVRSNSLVYLAGPITGLTFDGAADWRDAATQELGAHNIKGLSPLRAKDYLRSLGALSGTGEEYAHLGVLSLPRGVTTRDRFDATRCDALLVNLVGAKRVSIGTVMEIAWADLSRIPVVVAMEPEGNPHEHMMISESIGFRVPTLDEAIRVIVAIAGNERLS